MFNYCVNKHVVTYIYIHVYVYRGNIHISSPNLNFKLPSQIHPDLSMKLPCFCAILVGSLTRGSRFFNNGIWSVSFTLSLPIFGWFGGFSEFAGVCSGCGKMCCLLGIYGKKNDLRILKKKDTSKEGTKKMFVPKLLLAGRKWVFDKLPSLAYLAYFAYFAYLKRTKTCGVKMFCRTWKNSMVTLLEPTSFWNATLMARFHRAGNLEQVGYFEKKGIKFISYYIQKPATFPCSLCSGLQFHFNSWPLLFNESGESPTRTGTVAPFKSFKHLKNLTLQPKTNDKNSSLKFMLEPPST